MDRILGFNLFSEHIRKLIKKTIDNKYIIPKIYSMLAYKSIMYIYFCIRFIDFILKVNVF